MTRLHIVVEGQSEEIFVKKTLTPYLAERGVFVASPVVVWTKRLPIGGGFRGGVSRWNQVRNSLMPLTHDSNAWVTTLFDFYGLPDDFPGYQDALKLRSPCDQVIALEQQFSNEIAHPRFIPFFALHEFEAWLFTAPKIVAEHFGNIELAKELQKAVSHAGGPELINHGKDTHPKARLQSLNTGYGETSDGPALIEKIGITKIRNACPHFSDWLSHLEALGQVT
ncbi:MAG: DUF4276 family protein [Gallionellaceae bacterium]